MAIFLFNNIPFYYAEDKVADTRKKIIYDDNGNVCKQETEGAEKNITLTTTYDEDNNASASSVSIGETTRETTYEYDDTTPDVKLASVTLPNGVKQQSVYDKLGRLCEIKQDRNFVTFGKQLYYKQVGDHASNLIASEWFEKNGVVKERLHYTYDEKGNITAIKQNNTIIARYTYDSLSRLIREDNKLLDKTTILTYDIGGNILSKTEYPYSQKETSNLDNPIKTETYEYASNGWKDQLVTYNGQGVGNYDDLGNPRIYRDKRLIWSHGRQLDLIGNIRYHYNANGVRISKNVDGVITKFYTDGTTILAQECGEDTLIFTRGIDGLNGFNLNGTEYIYKKNVQGDIIAIMDGMGTEIARYTYDAWGNHTVQVLEDGAYTDEPTSNAYMKIAEINPYRYRSYYYDTETGLYYLNMRYYDPEVGRFINADDISYADPEQINGLNLYAYCLDNPIYNIDENGNKPKWWQWLLFGIGIAVIVVAGALTGVGGLVGAVAVGALKGALIGAAVGSVVGIAGGAIYSAATGADMGESILSGFLIGFGAGAIVGAIAGGVAGGYSYTPSGLSRKAINSAVKQTLADTNKMSHIMQPKHNLPNSIKQVGKLMKKTLINGTITPYKSVFSVVWDVASSKVTYAIIAGIIRISDMWRY